MCDEGVQWINTAGRLPVSEPAAVQRSRVPSGEPSSKRANRHGQSWKPQSAMVTSSALRFCAAQATASIGSEAGLKSSRAVPPCEPQPGDDGKYGFRAR